MLSNKRPKAYILGGGLEYIRLFYSLACDGAKDLDEADFVVFTGGEDVDPQLYGEVAMKKTNFNSHRDMKEAAVYKAALERELPMVGICRGGQFLNVMNGGKMWQHVTQHAIGGTHKAFVQVAPFQKGKKPREVQVTSTHHQMMIPAKHGMVLLTADEALEKLSPGYEKVGKHKDDPDIEAVFYDKTNCLCFQPHPEFRSAPAECVDLFEEFMDNFIYPNTPLKRNERANAPKGKPAAAPKAKVK